MTVRVGPEGGVDDFDVFFGDKFGIIIVMFIEVFFKGIIHGVNGGLAVVVAAHGIEVGFLDKKEQEK